MKKSFYVFNILLISIYTLFVLSDFFVSNGDFSSLENRVLAGKPEASLKNIINRSYMDDVDAYSNDQLVFRDFFIKAKAFMERAVGKKENNGVYFGKDNYLIEKPASFNKEFADKNLASVKEMAKTGKFNVSFCLIPQAFEILADKLPENAYEEDVKLLCDYINENLSGVSVCDVSETLKKHKDEYIFYRLDHHQTALGSYLVYEALGEALFYKPLSLDSFKKEEVTADFKGTTYSKGLSAKESDVISVYKNDVNEKAEVSFDGDDKKSGMFFESHLETKDKYSYFLDGNHALTIIEGGRKDGGEIAIFKDSYAHSIAPYLINHFEKIHLIDMRYYSDDPIKYLSENKIKNVLFLYGSSTFMTDETIAKTAEFAVDSIYLKSGLVAKSEKVSDAYFKDAVFLGDSLTMGLQAYSGISDTTFLCRTSMSVGGVFGEEDDGTSLADKVREAKAGKIYVMLGVNEEISESNKENVMEKYETLIDTLISENPSAKIFIQSILPYSEKKEASGKVKNKVIYDYNETLLKMAEEKEIYFVDVYNAVCDDGGFMKENLTTDGIHLNAEGCKLWIEYLKCHAIGGAVSEKETEKTEEKTFSGVDYNLKEIAEKIGKTVENEGDIGETGGKMLISTHGIDEEYISGAYGVVGGGAYAEEIALFEVSDEKYAKEVYECLKEYINVRIKSFESYIPKEVPKLEKAILFKEGKLVGLVVAKDTGDAEKILEESAG